MGIIVTVSGVSGSGKTTLMEHLLSLGPQYRIVQDATSRKRRDRDREGELLYFSDKEFSEKETSGEFLWTTPPIHGARYGTLRSAVNNAFSEDYVSVMMITAPYVKTLIDSAGEIAKRNVLGLYVLSPGEAVIRERLNNRGDDPTDIERRIEDCRRWDREAINLGISYPIQYLKNSRNVKLFLRNAEDRVLRFLQTR